MIPDWTASWLKSSLAVGALLLAAGLLFCLYRAARGPRDADRIGALALVMTLSVGLMAMLAVARADWHYLDAGLVLALLSGAVAIAAARASRAAKADQAPSQESDVSDAVVD